MILFDNWTLSVTGLVARQYDNLSRRIDIEGDLPAGYTWQLLVQCGGDADTLLLQPTETGVGTVLTADNLSKAGEYYFQLRGVLQSDGVTTRHTNIVSSFIPQSLTGLGTWPEVPTEFAQIEQRCAASMIAAESAAEAAKADADRAAALAAEVAEKAAQTAQDATESAQAKEAAQTAQRLADEAQSAAEAARNAAETAQAAAEQSATDAVGAKQGAEAALKAAQDAAAAADQALSDLQALYQEMQTWAQGVVQDVDAAGSAAVQSVQNTGDAQVQRVTAEGTTQTANAKAQADAAAQSAAGASQSAQQAAESAAVYGEVVSDVNQLKQDVASITPDDTAVNGKPWTSKHIVDSLCQPFEESGNPVQCWPVANYPLGVKIQIEPKQAGEGDPSPENVRHITGTVAVQIVHSNDSGASNTYDIALPETVYGGDLDLETGVLTVTHCFVTLTGNENWGKEGNYLFSVITPKGKSRVSGACTHFPYWDGVGSIDFVAGNYVAHVGWAFIAAGGIGKQYTVDEWKAYLAAQKEAGTPVHVCYGLAEPYTIQLTPQQITALSGVNTIYTDANGVIVTGAEDPKHTITELKNAIISLGGNV